MATAEQPQTSARLEYSDIAEMEHVHPELSAQDIADLMVDPLSPEDLRRFAKHYVSDFIETLRRGRAREVEVDATAAVVPTVPYLESDRFAAARSEPGAYVGNARARERFKRWMGPDFPEWYASGLERSMRAGDPAKVEMFEADWFEGGFKEYFRARTVASIMTLIEDESARIRLEVTEELLETIFALGDGTRVSWGKATVGQHEQRIALLVGTAAGTIETAARHQTAINMIRSAGVDCLSEVKVGSAS